MAVDILMTREEIADAFGFHEQTLRNWKRGYFWTPQPGKPGRKMKHWYFENHRKLPIYFSQTSYQDGVYQQAKMLIREADIKEWVESLATKRTDKRSPRKEIVEILAFLGKESPTLAE